MKRLKVVLAVGLAAVFCLGAPAALADGVGGGGIQPNIPACAADNNQPSDPVNPWTFVSDDTCGNPAGNNPLGGVRDVPPAYSADCTLFGAGLYKNTGTNQVTGYGAQNCDSGIDSQSDTVYLYEFWTSDSSWHLMAQGTDSAGSGGQITPVVRLHCNTNDYRYWSAYERGSFQAGNSFTAAQHYHNGYLQCKG